MSFTVIAAVAASRDHWQPTISYGSLQVAVTYAGAWPLSGQHGLKDAQVRWPLTAARTSLPFLYFTGFVHPSALPSFVSLVSTCLS